MAFKTKEVHRLPTPRKIQPIPDRLASDPVVRHVIAESAAFASVKSIRIFGSRARGGDHHL
ncbi:MAG: hypothetical protein EBU49_09550 [Proteobacteria bacterium]|nr:hypothetical protein [Pseudomonadota bacterium]